MGNATLLREGLALEEETRTDKYILREAIGNS